MIKSFPGEKWKRIKFGAEFTNKNVIEVSNFGRLRSFNKSSDGDIVNGSMTNGYRVIRFKLFKPRDADTTDKLAFLQRQVFKLAGKIKTMKEEKEEKRKIKESEELLSSLKEKLRKKFKEDTKKRTVYYHGLVHRLVAQYFCTKQSRYQSLVAHVDYNKLNNKSSNLKWMTPDENYAHQKNSPYVIAEKKERRSNKSARSKLTITKVMLLKKLLNQNKPMKTLVKQFKITDTQILRIKRGENWGEIKAAD